MQKSRWQTERRDASRLVGAQPRDAEQSWPPLRVLALVVERFRGDAMRLPWQPLRRAREPEAKAVDALSVSLKGRETRKMEARARIEGGKRAARGATSETG